MLNNWQRIEQVIKWAGAASVSAFAKDIGLNRGENLYQIKRGNNGISKELAENIASKYPSVSKAWLLTGEGDMLPGIGAKEKYDIPFYKTDAVDFVTSLISLVDYGNGERVNVEMPDPSYYVSYPMLKGCDFAAFSFSEAMHPDIPRGAIVFLKQINIDSLIPGGIYVVMSPDFNGIRYIRKDPKNSKLRLVPGNKEDFDEVIIETACVENIFHVMAVLINK